MPFKFLNPADAVSDPATIMITPMVLEIVAELRYMSAMENCCGRKVGVSQK